MSCPPISISPSAKYLWLVVVHFLVNQVHGAAFEAAAAAAAAAAAGSPTVAHSDTNERHKFGGFAEHALAHTWASRKIEYWDGSEEDVDVCFSSVFISYSALESWWDTAYEDKTGYAASRGCDLCCGNCYKTTNMDNKYSDSCVCSVLGTLEPSSTNKFYGSDFNDCIFITGNNREWIDASTPASEAAKERLPFPRAEMPPGAPKSERV